jgi:hypothetical protein
LDPTNAPKIQKPESKIKKPRGSDIKWSNPCGNQITHFTNYTKSPNAKNPYSNCKKTITTSDAKPTICVSSTNEGKTQVGWVAIVWQIMQR